MTKIAEELLIEYARTASEIRGFSEEYRWLSNFYEVIPFVHDGIEYKTTENFYQAMKTLDKNLRIHIAGLTPGQAKRFGNPENKKIVLREDWLDVKYHVMEFALRQKFSQDKFKDFLLSTRDIYIEETNTWNDIFWGCTPEGEGENNLGKLVMQLRKELQDGIMLIDLIDENLMF